jgi:hypothetical protein
MSKVITQQATVRTNTIKDSVCRIEVEAVKFENLWAGYPSEPPYVDPKTGKPPSGYANQCAIKVSVAIHKAGIEMKSFRGKGRVLVDGKNTASLAEELASWLKLQPFCGLPQAPENVTGEAWEKKIKGRTGIVFFANYWHRAGQPKTVVSGDHIDLWNGSRLTASGFLGTLVTSARFLGRRSFLPGTDWGYSDLGKATEILLWEIV